METYISILRGINVSGQKLIKMDALQKLYKNLGFNDVTTYVQSGNVIFTCENIEQKKLEQKISRQIEDDFGFNIPIIVLTIDDLKQIIDNSPFSKDSNKEQTYLHVTFLSSVPENYDKESIETKKQGGEEVAFTNKAIYLYCPNGYGKTKLNNNFIEAKLKVVTTTRNWKTTNELLRIAIQTNKKT